jgi:hypothetical protein
MRGISAGSRVWVKQNDEVQFGVIQTIGKRPVLTVLTARGAG